MQTTIKLDRISRSIVDDYAAAACLLRERPVKVTNSDGITEIIDLREMASRMDKYLLKEIFESMFPAYTLIQYNVDRGVATVEALDATPDENAPSGGRG